MTADLSEITVSLDDLSDEGLDVQLRIGLKTDKRQIEWGALGDLIERFRVSLSPISEDPVEWNAIINEPRYLTEFGESPRTATAKVVIQALFPTAPSMRFKRRHLDELLSEEYKESWVGYSQQRYAEQLADAEAPAGTPEGDSLVVVTVRAWDAV